MLFNLRLQTLALSIRHNLCPDASVSFQHSKNDGLVFPASPGDPALPFVQVHVPRLPADEGFVYLYLAAHLASEYVILQGKTNAVKHEPCGFLGKRSNRGRVRRS